MFIQVLWNDGTIHQEWQTRAVALFPAVQEAERHLRDPAFEGDYMRILSGDGELLWDSSDADDDDQGNGLSDGGSQAGSEAGVDTEATEGD